MAAPTASPTVSSTVGLKNMVIAPLTEDTEETVSYGTLQAVAGAIEATITPESADPDVQYADDVEFDTLYPDPEISFSTSMADIPLTIQEMIFGNQISSLQQKLSLQQKAVTQYQRALEAANKKLENAYTRQGKLSDALDQAKQKNAALESQVAAAHRTEECRDVVLFHERVGHAAMVPLSEMFGYSTAIRTLSSGRASYSMEPSHFEQVPQNPVDQIVTEKAKSVSYTHLDVYKRQPPPC